MFKRSLSQLDKLPKLQVAEWLSGIDTIICGTDGVLWQENNPIDGSMEAFNAFTAKGKRCLMVTNDCCLTSSDLIQKAKCMGFKAQDQDILSSAGSISSYLTDRKFKKKVLVLGGNGICKELQKAGFCSVVVDQRPDGRNRFDFVMNLVLDPDVGAVLVGRNDSLRSNQLIVACNYLQDPKVLFLTTCTDAFLAFGKRRIPDAGTVAAAIQVIVNRMPTVLGKPNPRILGKLLESGEIKPERTLVIGSSLRADIAFANICGFHSLLVGQDNGALEEAENIKKEGNEKKMKLVPDTFLPSLAPILELLSIEVKPGQKSDKKPQETVGGSGKQKKQSEK
ncbi:glycerol-3-phosphate phosphatase [Drosophila elegans]|uniref:glycerol-3-phosphate phosphatase n=1 Tax=Drosophila elegans TaxID=30023 RepID=UPI0007E77653|nr:glycerol-3-phosphate phosphatase [Drosophila elegans]